MIAARRETEGSVDDRQARRNSPGAAAKSRLRSSPRVVSLYRGVRGFVLGGDSRDGSPRARATGEGGVGLLSKVGFERSPRTGYRLNLVLPTVDAARTFGGIQTALDLFHAVGADVGERRIVSLGASGAPRTDAISAYRLVGAGELDPDDPLQVATLGGPASRLGIRADDVFVATFWTTAELVGRIRRWQAATYGSAPDRFGYIIQDFEPGFYPWSAQWMLARATYAAPDEMIGIFNTSVLRDYFHSNGIRFTHEHTFEPRLLPRLRSAMDAPAASRTPTIVVYGRPGTPRNAFPAIVDGLRAWRAADPNATAWSVISVGQPHPEIDLGGGVALRSIGKLDLDAYAALLSQSAIGISLMISPHPSYPPLEMAHLGMLVLTNRFADKDLSSWHANIRSIDDVSAASLANALSGLCRRFEADPKVGAEGRSGRPDYLSDDPQFPFADQLAAELRAAIDRDAGG
jgi:hypothetical protein